MKLTFLGHSALLIEEGNFKGLVDPFISGNPSCKIRVDDLTGISHIFVTHGHGDHMGDTIDIARKNQSLIITNFEISNYLSRLKLRTHAMHIGGRTKFDFGRVKMTSALHGSGISDGDNMLCGGNPGGFVIELGGKKVYHAGDTGLTYDMKLLEDEKIDVAFLPIGGNYTMDIDDAVKACDFIKAKIVVPMHYNTFGLISANPQIFKNKAPSEVVILDVNETMIV